MFLMLRLLPLILETNDEPDFFGIFTEIRDNLKEMNSKLPAPAAENQSKETKAEVEAEVEAEAELLTPAVTEEVEAEAEPEAEPEAEVENPEPPAKKRGVPWAKR